MARDGASARVRPTPRLSRAAIAEGLARLTPAQLADLDALLRSAPVPFNRWLKRTTPAWDWDAAHLRLVQDALDAMTRGDCDRIITIFPPRHGKSEQNTIRYPVYRMAADATFRAVIAAYGADLAAKFSRKGRRLARQIGLGLNEEHTAVDDWETLAGGGMRAVGVGGGVTGMGADLICIDDPVKSRTEAESLVYREKVWDWYRDDLYTRLEPKGAILLTMTRWHDDDLVGRILNNPDAARWHVIHLPALAEPTAETPDPLGRAEGQALWPARYDEAALADIRAAVLEYGFAALYQGRPRPREGVMFPRDRVQIVAALPGYLPTVRYWDKAGSKEGRGARTAGVKMAGPDREGLYYVCDAQAFRLEAFAREERVRQTAQLDGTGVHVWTEQEPGSGGKESAQATVKGLAGFTIHAEPVSGDKVTRADPFAAQWQAGNVRLLAGAWNAEYLAEAEAFPTGRLKDLVDASAGAFNKLALRPNVAGARVAAPAQVSAWTTMR